MSDLVIYHPFFDRLYVATPLYRFDDAYSIKPTLAAYSISIADARFVVFVETINELFEFIGEL